MAQNGSIRYRGKQKIAYLQYRSGGRHRQQCLETSDPTEARHLAQEILNRVRLLEERRNESPASSLSSAIQQEVTRLETDVSPRQAERVEYALENFLRFAGDIPIERIDARLIERYQRWRLTTPRPNPNYKPPAMENRPGKPGPKPKAPARPQAEFFAPVTRACVEKEICYIRRLLRRIGIAVAKPLAIAGRENLSRPFSDQEIVKLFNHLTGEMYVLCLLSLFTGARLAELRPSPRSNHVALLKTELDAENNRVQIRTAKLRARHERKTRVIPIPEAVMEIVVEHARTVEGPHVFRQMHNLPRNFNECLEKAGIPKRNELSEVLTFHSLRHTTGRLYGGEVSDFALMHILGHNSTKTTRRYVELSRAIGPQLPLPLTAVGLTQTAPPTSQTKEIAAS